MVYLWTTVLLTARSEVLDNIQWECQCSSTKDLVAAPNIGLPMMVETYSCNDDLGEKNENKEIRIAYLKDKR